MNTLLRLSTFLVIAGLSSRLAQADIVADFENLSLSPENHVAGGPGQTSFSSGGLSFNQTFSQFGSSIFPSAFSYSNRTDTVTTGPGNQFSAYTSDASGGAGGSSNYAVANNFAKGLAKVQLGGSFEVQGFHVTNTTYAYHSIVSGDDGGGNFVTQFSLANDDWFKLEIFGLDSGGNELGSVDYYLADYRGSAAEVTSDWTWVDLTSLGTNVAELQFELSSSDSGEFGMNTPAYFALDNVTVSAVPEPSQMFLLLAGTLGICLKRGKKRRNQKVAL